MVIDFSSLSTTVRRRIGSSYIRFDLEENRYESGEACARGRCLTLTTDGTPSEENLSLASSMPMKDYLQCSDLIVIRMCRRDDCSTSRKTSFAEPYDCW